MADLETLPTTDAEGLQNISETGKAPPSRIADYKSAAEIVKHLIVEDEIDRQDRVNEQALFDGQGPFIQEELDAAGQQWRQNNNWGGASSKFEQALAPYYDLLNGFTVEFDPTVQGAQREEFAARIAESWTNLHTRFWREHSYHDNNLFRLFVGFGIGVADFEHPLDWRWRGGGLGEHYFPRPMQAFENAANIHVRVREYREDELYRWYINDKAEGIGFNKEEIKKAMLACDQSRSGHSDYWNDLSNNIYGRTYSRRAQVRIFTMRVVEMTDEGEQVSEYMGMADGSGGDFIYKSKRPQWQDSMADCFTLFTAGIGNGDLHSVKGLGRKIFATEQTKNQFVNQMFDFARIYMSPMFKSDDANAATKLASMQISLFNLIPPGLELVPATASPNYSESLLPLLGFADNLGQQATGVYTQQLAPAAVEQTREEVVQRSVQNAVQTSTAVSLYVAAKERCYNIERVRLQRRDWRPTEPGYRERKMFLADLVQRGVPEEVWYHVSYIKPNRQVGGGSAGVGQMLLKEAAALRGYLDPVGQKVLDEMVLTRLIGPDNTKVLIPNIGIQRTLEQQRFAMDENTFFVLGAEKPVLPDDDHFLHAQTHDAAIPDIQNKFAQQQITPQQMLGFLNLFIPHQKQHLAALEGNKQQATAVAQFNLDLNKAVQTQEHLQNQIQAEQNRMAQQAATQQGAEAGNAVPSGIAESQAKIQSRAQEAQLEMNIDAAKAQQDMAQEQAAHAQKLQHRQETHQQDAALKDAGKANDILNSSHPSVPVPTLRPTIPPQLALPAPR